MKTDSGLIDVLSSVLDRVERMPDYEPGRFSDEPGDVVEGQGIFLGKLEMKYSLPGKVFNVYAAPEDLKTREQEKAYLNYNDTVARVAELKKWHGHNGGSYETFRDVFNALEKGSYKGEWFIPGMALLSGREGNGQFSLYDCIYRHQNAGSFKGTFDAAAAYPPHYWSSTVEEGAFVYYPRQVDFATGKSSLQQQLHGKGLCRPVRLVETVSP
jgi:hypothetical protein